METRPIDSETFKMLEFLGLPRRDQANPYVVLSVRGDGIRAPEAWTATVYRNNTGQLKLVTSDLGVLQKLLHRGEPKRIIQVDDAGWGFPLGGVMIGATDGTKVETGLIETKYFQGELFKSHAYLLEAARITLELVNKLGGCPGETPVEICSGYVNSRSKEALQQEGFEVLVTEITGLLQDQLEKRFKEYAESLGYPAYYDPKETRSPAMAFKEVIKWIDEDPDSRLKIAKTGWKYFRNRRKT